MLIVPDMNQGALQQINGYQLTTVAVVFSFLSIAAVVARFYASRLRSSELGPDDWICVPALVGCVCLMREGGDSWVVVDCLSGA